MSAIQIETMLADPQETVHNAAAAVLEVLPPLNLEAWAVANVRFGQEAGLPSDIQGSYDPKRFPFFTRIFHVLGPEHPAREVVLKKSAQLGGTVLAMIVIGGYLDADPKEILYTHPTEGNATRWAKMKWRRFAKGVSGLRQLFLSTGSKDSGSTILYQERRDGRGFIQVSGANSEASLSMLTAELQIQDDLSKWEPNNAGDPEEQADSRSKSKKYAKIFKVSTPLLSDNCKISRRFEHSTQEHYHVACPHCGFLQPLTWENFRDSIDPEHPERAHFTCGDCGAAMEERDRDVMMDPARGAKWVAEKPSARIVGFHLWSAYSPLESWAAIAAKWLMAEGDPQAEQTFFNDWLGLEYHGAGEAPPWEAIRDRSEKGAFVYRRGTIAAGGLFVTIGVDCQGNRVEWQAVAWGRDRRRYVVDYGVIQGHISEAETRAELDKVLDREWTNAWGRRMSAKMLAIDANYETDAVLDWSMSKGPRRVIAVRGIKGDVAPDLVPVNKFRRPDGRPFKGTNRYFYNVGAAPMKGYLYKALEKADPDDRGFIGIPAGMGDEYFQMMTAEVRKPVKQRDGSRQYMWVKREGQANEALDNMIYAEAAAVRVSWKGMTDSDFDALAAEFERPADNAQGDIEDLLTTAAPDGPRKTPEKPKPETPPTRGWGALAAQNRGDE